ncbi:MAG TPA: hypothetical protein VHV75_05175 [Solirubrobacteraceae bacterium]|jgi:hypothetical protein|nr:hypothetical protein [Solirubrobacteraceae bacterium]
MPDLTDTTAPGDAPTPEGDAALQRALAEAVSAFGQRARQHGELPAFPSETEVAATDVAFTAAAMLKAAEVYSFEIAALFNV